MSGAYSGPGPDRTPCPALSLQAERIGAACVNGYWTSMLPRAPEAQVVEHALGRRRVPEARPNVHLERVVAHAAPSSAPYDLELLPVVLVLEIVLRVRRVPVGRPLLRVARHVEQPVR